MPRSPQGSKVGAEPSGGIKDRPESGSGSEDEDEDDILEISQNGRWQKINQQVTRDIPGIDAAFLAMDTDDGVEVVWNEVRYSNRKVAGGSKERLVKILQRLTEVKHNNIVNFIDFWHDKVQQQDRLVFITEYMTSGSLMQFLKKAKKTKKTISEKMWRRWCRQILSALSYLHKNDIMHGNLSLASIFIQHNGLVKIGSVSPEAIHQHVKTKMISEETKRMHYTAPEYAGEGPIQTSADLYSFGICALEMLNLELLGNGDSHPGRVAMKQLIQHALEGLDEPRREFIKSCLQEEPSLRPRATSLLKQAVLQEVFNLKVLSALALSQRVSRERIEAELERRGYSQPREPDEVLAVIPGRKVSWKFHQVPPLDLDKFFEEIQLDVLYDPRPLTTHSPQKKDDSCPRVVPPSSNSSSERTSSQFYEQEARKVMSVNCDVRMEGDKQTLFLRLQFDDKMERELRSELKQDDTASALSFDLVLQGLISEDDRETVEEKIASKLVIS